MKVTFGRSESYSSGWKGKQSHVEVRVDKKVVGEVRGRENPGIAGAMTWTVELKGRVVISVLSMREGKALALKLLTEENRAAPAPAVQETQTKEEV